MVAKVWIAMSVSGGQTQPRFAKPDQTNRSECDEALESTLDLFEATDLLCNHVQRIFVSHACLVTFFGGSSLQLGPASCAACNMSDLQQYKRGSTTAGPSMRGIFGCLDHVSHSLLTGVWSSALGMSLVPNTFW